jgi:hypothetical protein
MVLPPCGTAVGACCCGAGQQGPGIVPRDPATKVLSCRRTHGGKDLTSWGMAAADVGFGCRCIFLEKKISSIYFSKIKEKNIKKFKSQGLHFGGMDYWWGCSVSFMYL